MQTMCRHCRRNVWLCLIILLGWRLKGQNFPDSLRRFVNLEIMEEIPSDLISLSVLLDFCSTLPFFMAKSTYENWFFLAFVRCPLQDALCKKLSRFSLRLDRHSTTSLMKSQMAEQNRSEVFKSFCLTQWNGCQF